MKNLVIAVLTVIAIAEGLVIFTHETPSQPKTALVNPTTRPRISFLTKGMILADSPISKFAYKISPGTLSTSAQTALSGWDIKTSDQADGSVSVTLTPKDSSDQSQVYNVPSGDSLYFVEQTSADDKSATVDSNLRDDYGVLVDKNGVVQ